MSQADQEEPLLAPEELAGLLTALEAAWRPGQLDRATNERLIEMALEDPLAPPTDEERVESARLRDALEQGAAHEAEATLAVLRAAFKASDASEPRIEGSVNQAVDEALRSVPSCEEVPAKPRSNVIFAVFGATSAALAAAALVLLFVGTASRSAHEQASASNAESALARPRSTAALFRERFDTEGTTARMDAIARARSRDLRDNRFASWGVR